MLDLQQLERATARLKQMETRLEIRLDLGPDPEDPFAKVLGTVINQLSGIAEAKLEVVLELGISLYPSFSIKNITYLAAPLERELDPFLDLLVLLSRGEPIARPAAPLDPAKIEVLIASTCPNCPSVVKTCGQVAATLPEVEMVVVDVQYFKELAGSCRSVPTVIIDGMHTVIGPLTEKELLQMLAERGKPGYLTSALGSMIEARRLNEMVPFLKRDEGYVALANIMRDGSMQQKMGLLLAVEEALEQNPHSLDEALPHLLPLLSVEDATVRGDTADLLGKIGAPGARAALTRLLSDENPDVCELAADSLQMLREPS